MAFCKLLLRLLFISVFIVIINSETEAQSYYRKPKFHNYWKVTFHGGPSIFYGDIKQNKILPVTTNVNELRFAGGINLEFQFSAPLSIGLQGIYGNLSGTRRNWGIYFISDYIETNFFINVNFNNLFFGYKPGRFFQAYAVFGGGFLQYNMQQRDLESDQVIDERGHGDGKGIGGRSIEGILTYGLGISFRLSHNWALNLQSANRIMKTDEYDAFKNSYPYDVYNYTSIGFVYKFGPSRKIVPKRVPRFRLTDHDVPPSPVLIAPMDTASMAYLRTPLLSFQTLESVQLVNETTNEKNKETAGLNYRVQILARFTGPLSVEQISRVFKIPASDITQETFQGHYIYTIGRFGNYNEARIKRDEIRYFYGIGDAFVVAFDEGKRLEKLPAGS